MRVVRLDPYEFASTSSEEHAAVVSADRRQFPSLDAFIQTTDALLGDAVPARSDPASENGVVFDDDPLAAGLLHRCGVARDGLKEMTVRSRTWDAFDVVLTGDGRYVRVIWFTTA